jgi:hypothetical protein
VYTLLTFCPWGFEDDPRRERRDKVIAARLKRFSADPFDNDFVDPFNFEETLESRLLFHSVTRSRRGERTLSASWLKFIDKYGTFQRSVSI